jgi:hypothetical protein
MMKSSLFHEMYMMYAEAYAPNVVEQLKQKFKKQDAALTDEVMEWYINRFNAIKDSPRIINFVRRIYKIDQPTDIFNYSWSQLETTVDQLPAPETRPKREHVDEPPPESQLIYDENQLKIYDAPSKQACIHLGHHQFGKSYTFCVSRPMGGNMYDSYRFKKRSFYFVYDESLPQSNTRHLLVIQAGAQNDDYIVTNATNDFEKQMNWQQVVKMQPKLQGLQHLFEYHEFSAKEKMQADLAHADAETFDELSYEKKVAYIAMGKTIYMDSWLDLPRDLKKTYADVAAPRVVYNFFAYPPQFNMPYMDPVRVLQQHLPQEAARYAKRAAENYEAQGKSTIRTADGIKVYEFDLYWGEVAKNLVDGLSEQVRQAIDHVVSMPLDQALNRAQLIAMYDAQTMMLQEFKLQFEYKAVFLNFNFNGDELKNCSIKFAIGHNANMHFGTNIDEMQKMVQLLGTYDAVELNKKLPQLFKALSENAMTEYAPNLFARCIIDDVEIKNAHFKKFMKRMAANAGDLRLPKQSFAAALKKLQQSQLFKQLLQRPDKAPLMLKPFMQVPQTYLVTLYDDETFKQSMYAFDANGKALAEYKHMSKVFGFSPHVAVFKRMQDDDAVPEYIRIHWAGVRKQQIFDAADVVENLRQKRLNVSDRKKMKASELSDAAKHYLHLKALGRNDEVDPQEYHAYIQEHGVQNEIKVGRKTIINNNAVFIGNFADTSAVLSTPTLNNLTQIAQAWDVAWNRIFIQPLLTRVAFSFFIEGKNDDDETIYYCRKEFNAQGAGQSFLINATTGVQQSTTDALYHIHHNE